MLFIDEFINALDEEIDALKRGKNGNVVTVYNGKLLQQLAGFYIYQFTLENFLTVLEDTPAEIEISGQLYKCVIVSLTGQQIQISIEQKLPQTIPVAKIKTNNWYLLELLKNKYQENLNNHLKFQNSNRLFQDQNSKIDGGNSNPSYSKSKHDVNPSQRKAIESSINDFVSIIWGPPGTGKTETIAKAIESHLNLGRRVLLLSHSNNAVDQALIKVAKQTEKNYYKERQVVRLGIPKVEMLEKINAKYPYVLMENIANEKSKVLSEEKSKLITTLEWINKEKTSLDQIVQIETQLGKLRSEIDDRIKERNKYLTKMNAVKNDIYQLQNEISKIQENLDKAEISGFWKRTFLRLDPVKIEANLNENKSKFSIKTNEFRILEEQVRDANLNINSLTAEKNGKENSLIKKLAEIGKSHAEIEKELKKFNERINQIQNRLDEINKAIEEIKIQILKEAKLVATTLTKSYIARELEAIDFDILIVDEISMAPMPMLYWAASKVKKGITIVGDFLQLPPICVSDKDIARKWLGRSIFDQLEISLANAESKTKLLNTQYRMHPDISEIPKREIYKNKLENDENTLKKIKSDKISGKTAVCLIDTSLHNPWCSQPETGGRFNIISALICVSLAEKIAASFTEKESIGIITPYRNQARLILKIAQDKGLIRDDKELKPKIRINTVHSFQGGEETAIIFDSVEGEGAKKWSFINENSKGNHDNALRLLNVAITRAEKKFYVVANGDYFQRNFADDTLFMELLKHIEWNGKIIESTKIIADLQDENFDYWIEKINSLKNSAKNFEVGYKANEFWTAFPNDLAKAEKELIIFSPYLTNNRFGKLHLIFTELLSKGIKIYVITLPPNDKSQLQDATEVIGKMKEMDIVVKFEKGMHEKIAIIDRKVKWIGSLNILSHNTRKEYMERVEGENSSKELFDKFDLENLLINHNINGETCPLPNCSGYVFPNFSQRNNQNFFGCTNYPSCKFSANIKMKSFDQLASTKTGARRKVQNKRNRKNS